MFVPGERKPDERSETAPGTDFGFLRRCMKKPALLLICLLLLIPFCAPAEEEAVLPDTWYELSPW